MMPYMGAKLHIYQIDGEPWLQTDPVHMQISRGPSLRVLTVRCYVLE